MDATSPKLTKLGPYQIVEELGHGGMATVYKGYHPALDRTVAIKVLPRHLAADPTFLERFHREAKAVARLAHPAIPAVHDTGDVDGIAYIVTDFVDGVTLSERLGRPMPLEDVVALLEPLAEALDHAHSHGVVHRDVKPTNIMVDREGQPRLTDFGLARILESGLRLTRVGMVVGTPAYMAPEQGMGLEAGGSVDQYALAVVAFEMLTGRVPFIESSAAAMVGAHVTKPVPAPSSIAKNLVPAIDAVMLRALSKQAGDRYPSCSAFIAALAGRATDA